MKTTRESVRKPQIGMVSWPKALHIVLAMALLSTGCRRDDGETASPTGFVPSDQLIAEHNRGVALMGQFNFGKAHDVFAQLTERNPNWIEARIDWAIAMLNRREPGDDRHAAEILERVLDDDPDQLCAIYCRAILHLYGSQPREALARFRQVAEADPTDAYAVYYTGQCLMQLSEYEEAILHFEKAQQMDPYLRSAYYGAFQAAQQLRRAEDLQNNLEQFRKLEDNPQARLAEIKYTRMGPKADVLAMGRVEQAQASVPAGDLFATATPLAVAHPAAIRWSEFKASNLGVGVTVCDVNSDGRLDLFVNGALDNIDGVFNALLLKQDNGYMLVADHPLARVADVTAALWGDYDNDGHTDVYLCRRGPNQLWRQKDGDSWEDVTDSTQTAAGPLDTIDGGFFDADHDGDLDLLLVNRDGPNELLNNNLDGTFRPLAAEQGLQGKGAARGLAVADLDADRDVDFVIINDKPPHEVYLNDRLWSYHEADISFAAFRKQTIWSAIAADVDVDGQTELLTVGPDGVAVWSPNEAGVWTASALNLKPEISLRQGPMAAADLDGDGRAELLLTTVEGWAVVDLAGAIHYQVGTGSTGSWAMLATGGDQGYAVVAARSGNSPLVWQPGPGRLAFASLDFSGKEEKADQMRSNASGIGVEAAVRVGSNWSALSTYRPQSGPGQSRQPVAVGLRGSDRMDFVSLRWPDGVFQSEIGLAAGQLHAIEETQRQVSSCPIVFAWNGERYQFVTDVLGTGGIGFNLGRGEYAAPRPWENLLLPAGLIVPRHGRYEIKLGEPMQEAMYLDSACLVAYDLPPEWQMTLDERFATAVPEATGEPRFHRRVYWPTHAINDRCQDVTELVTLRDGVAAPPGQRDRRFLGRTETHSIELTFAQPLDQAARQLQLVFHGWIEYPYSQTMFAAWQAGAAYEAPTIEAQSADGAWHVVLEQFGYPAGMPREASVSLPLERLPAQTRRLRITTNLEVYWDAVWLAAVEDCPDVRRREMSLVESSVTEVGFPRRQTYPQRRPDYKYERRDPIWDARHQTGFYTSFGDAKPLLETTDDAVAIIGPGEEIHLAFSGQLPAVPTGWSRRFVLETCGWCKDMDLYTEDGEQIEPLPTRERSFGEESQKREELHRRLNRRFCSG